MGVLTGSVATLINPSLAPNQVSGLTWWLRPEGITGLLDLDPVTTWPDSSTTNLSPTQATAGQKPLYRTNQVNGYAIVRFDGTDDILQTSSVAGSTFFSTGPNTMFVVQRQTVSNNQGTSVAWDSSPTASPATNRVILHLPYEEVLVYDHGNAGAGGRISVAAPAGFHTGFHIVEVHRGAAPSQGEIVLDGAVLVQGTFTDDLDTTASAPLAVGGLPTTGGTFAYLNGDLAEVIVYNRELTAAERLGVRNHLAGKYGISVVTAPLSELEEFNGPFASWRNIVTTDGADPTAGAVANAAFQSALASGAKTIYLPAGTYRLTASVGITPRRGLRIIGHDPNDTTILWDGPAGVLDPPHPVPDTTPPQHIDPVFPACFVTDGLGFGTIARITFDGQNRVGSTGVELGWVPDAGDPPSVAETTDEFVDCKFKNLGWGVRCGTGNNMGSEVHFRRCHFVNNTLGAVSTWNYNALDVWIDDSLFENCYVNATNEGHNKGRHVYAGNFHMRRCRSRGATWSFASFCNTSQNFHFLDCISYQDNSFLNACEIGVNGAAVVIQRCKILDPVLNLTPDRVGNFTVKPWHAVIEMGNPGPLVVMDTDIRLPVGWSTDWAVVHVSGTFTFFGAGPEADGTLIDCRCSNEASIGAFSVNGDLVNYNTQFVPRAAIETPEAATGGIVHCPLTARSVFEPATPTAAGIQAAIDTAAAFTGQRPVVHVPTGDYLLTAGLTLPVGSDTQLVGDGFDEGGTRLLWRGAAGVRILTLSGPCTVALRDLYLHGDIFAAHGTGDGIRIQGADQGGARVQGVGLISREPGDNEATIDLAATDNVVVRLDAALMGPSDNTGRTTLGSRATGGTALAGGSATAPSALVYLGVAAAGFGDVYRVLSGGRIVATAGWWENGQRDRFLLHDAAGTLDFLCYNVQPAHVRGNQWESSGGAAGDRDAPDIIVNNPTGDYTELAVTHAGPYLSRRRITGTGTNARALLHSGTHQGQRDDKPWASQTVQIENNSPFTKFLLLQAKGTSHDGWLYPLGDIRTNVTAQEEESTVRSLLSRLRTRLPSVPPAGIKNAPSWARVLAVPPGATDIWISRVQVTDAWVPFRVTT